MRVDSTWFSELLADSLARGEAVLLRVQGVSMLPWFREGQKVRIEPAANRRLRKGDVVLFWREPRHPILHRIVRLSPNGDWVECRGDSEVGGPERVPLSAVIGVAKVSAFRRWQSVLLNPARQWVNRLLARRGIVLRHG